MPYELFLALRYLRARRRGRFAFARVTALAATAGVACGVAALIVALALANGFRDEMRDKILRGTAHVTLTRADGASVRDWPVLRARLLEVPGVVGATATSYTGALLSGADGVAYAVLRGVEPTSERELRELRRTLVAGSLEPLLHVAAPLHGQAPPDDKAGDDFAALLPGGLAPVDGGPPAEVIVGAELAARTGLRQVGDEGWIVTGERSDAPPGLVPRARRVRVAGVFRAGLFEYDSSWLYLALPEAAEIEGAAAVGVPVVNVETNDIYQAATTATRVRAALGAEFAVVDWQQANRPLFAALALERRTVGFIIALVVLVAALNITTTLVLVVNERRADIAILNALGARAHNVMLVFMLEGATLGAAGAALGVGVGLAACRLADRYALVSLPADVYSLNSIPLHPRPRDAALAAFAALIISLLATLYPARAAARLRPAEALRGE